MCKMSVIFLVQGIIFNVLGRTRGVAAELCKWYLTTECSWFLIVSYIDLGISFTGDKFKNFSRRVSSSERESIPL